MIRARGAVGRRLLTALLFVGLVAGPAAGSAKRQNSAAGSQVIAAVPGSRAGTYATPVIVVQPGDDITFLNAEPFPHDVRSVAMGPDNTTWCKPWEADEPQHRIRNPRQFPIGKCPLLWTPPISMTLGSVQTKVYGAENLRPGTIEFYCTVFPAMRGQIKVI